MSNSFRIPLPVEEDIRRRDKRCVYCRNEMKLYLHTRGTPRDKATIEHFNYDGPFYWTDGIKGLKKEDIGICCGRCNSSRGNKKLVNWFKKDYCKKNGITIETIAGPVKEYLKRNSWKK